MAGREPLDYTQELLKAENGDERLVDLFDRLFGDVDARLRGVEAAATSVAELQGKLLQDGQDIIDEVVGPLTDRIRSAADIGVIFTAGSVSEATVGLGVRTFVVVEADRAAFAPAAMLTVTATDTPAVAMFGRKVAYERDAGVLEIEVLSAEGAGAYAGWTVTAGSRVANASQSALTPVEGFVAQTVQASIAALAEAVGNDPAFAEHVVAALAEIYTKTQTDDLLGAKATKTTALTALAALVPAADRVVSFSSANGATLLPAGAIGKALLAAADSSGGLAILGAAPLNAPTFTGAVSAPTVGVGNNSTRVATTAFVQAAIAALVNSSPAALDTLVELATALGNDANFATTMNAALAARLRYDAAQALTDAQKAQVVANVGLDAVYPRLDGGNAGGFGVRNRLINGDFRFAQRGLSQTAGGYGSLDRWYLVWSGSGMTVSQADTGEGGFCARLALTVAGNYTFEQRIEHAATLAGRKVTFSFEVRTISGSGHTIRPTIIQRFNDSASVAYGPAAVAGPADSTGWVKFSYTVDLTSAAGKTYGVGHHLAARITVTNPCTIEIRRAQFEEGGAATPFERRPEALELALCQRYFAKTYPVTTPLAAANAAGALTASPQTSGSTAFARAQASVTWELPVAMRATPAVTPYSPVSGATTRGHDGVADAIAEAVTSDKRILLRPTGTVASGQIYSYHATADAEL
ncbi:hypothetical protein [Methylopila sp. 73B]|uniref:hypothetical protein n=1 Tax=Methylopila sp. 73B TaxID=1120792 RepID=UPI0003738169|nr:hypothetical protein [Methylopila sp. 73B]